MLAVRLVVERLQLVAARPSLQVQQYPLDMTEAVLAEGRMEGRRRLTVERGFPVWMLEEVLQSVVLLLRTKQVLLELFVVLKLE